jgi:hypothetical protein
MFKRTGRPALLARRQAKTKYREFRWCYGAASGVQRAEVKTVAVGEVKALKSDEEIHGTQLSYFSRMLDAQTSIKLPAGIYDLRICVYLC